MVRSFASCSLLVSLFTGLACSGGGGDAPANGPDPALRLTTSSCSSDPLACSTTPPEEEVFGDIWVGGSPTSSAEGRYHVTLEPDLDRDPGYPDRAARYFDPSQIQSTEMLTNAAGHWGWYFREMNRGKCEQNPVETDTLEVHIVPGEGVPSGKEQHCIVPGAFRLTIEDTSTGSVLVDGRPIDFIAWDQNLSGRVIEAESFSNSNTFVDNVVHVDVGGNAASITPRIETPISGVHNEPVEFNAGATTTTWSVNEGRGRVSALWTWDKLDPQRQSGYMNTRNSGEAGDSQDVVRVHTYDDTTDVTAGAEFLTPSTNGEERTQNVPVTLTQGPPGEICFHYEVVGGAVIGSLKIRVTWDFECIESSTGNPVEHRWIFGDGSKTAWMEGTSDRIHTYADYGTYTVRIEAREVDYPDNDAMRSESVTLEPPPDVDDAAAVSNSLPSNVTQGQFYAVSATFDNTGTTTWTSGDGYRLRNVAGFPDFGPFSVSTSSTVSPGERVTFNFTLYSEADSGLSYDVYYQMEDGSGATFGESTGRSIYVSSSGKCTSWCELAYHGPAFDPTGVPTPGGASGGPHAARVDTVQSIVIDEYRLRFEEQEDGRRVAHVRYYGALGAAWPVDVTMRLRFEPGTINVGQVRRGVALSGYGLEVLAASAEELEVRLRRQAIEAALPTGESLLLDIPLVSTSKTDPPDRLPRVEVLVER